MTERGDTTDILAAVEHVARDLEFHIADSHAIHKRLAEHDSRIEGQVSQVEKHVGILADTVLGKRNINFDGQIIRDGGMQSQLAHLYELSQNGGFRVHLPPEGVKAQVPWTKILAVVGTVITAVIGAAATIIVAIIQSQPPTP